jgi:hypothetical protein
MRRTQQRVARFIVSYHSIQSYHSIKSNDVHDELQRDLMDEWWK